MKRRSLTAKLLLAYLPFVCVTVIGLFVLLEVRFYIDARADLVRQLQQLSRVQAATLGTAVWEYDGEQIDRSMAELRGVPFVLGARVETPDGRVLGRAGLAYANPTADDLRVDVGLSFSSEAVNEPVGRLLIVAHDGPIWNALRLRIGGDILIVLVLAAAIAGATVVATRVVIRRPLARLEEAATAMAAGHLDARSDAPPQDEIGDLAKAFNAMADSLVERGRELEQRVAARTAELAASEARFRAIIDAAPDPVLIIADSGVITYANEGAEQLFGYSGEEFAGLHSGKLVPPAFRDALAARLVAFFADPVPRQLGVDRNFLVCDRNGRGFPAEINIAPVAMAGGMHLAAAIRDVTQRREAEAALARTESQLRLTLASMPGGIFMVDADMRLRVWNRRLQELYGLPDDLLYEGAPLADIVRIRAERGEYGPGDLETLIAVRLASYRTGEHERREERLANGRIIGLTRSPTEDGGAVVVFSDITERRRAEARLEFTQNTVDNAADPIYWVDLDNEAIVYANHAASRALGYSRDELTAMRLRQIDPYVTDEVMARTRGTLARDDVATFETRHRRKDGSLIDIDITVFAETFEGAELGVAFARDITERKRAARAVRESQALLQNIIDNTQVIIFVKDREGRYTLMNREWEKALGLSRETSIGKTLTELVPYGSAQVLSDNDRRAMESGETVRTEEVIEFPDGRRTVYYAVKVPMRGTSGEIEGLCGIATDITDLKRSEAALQFTQSTVDNAADPIYWFNLETQAVVYANHAASRVMGYARDELLAMRIDDLDPYVDVETLARARETLEREKFATFETRHRRKDGTLLDVEINAFMEKYHGTDLAVAFARDTTERKRAARVIRDSQLLLQSIIDNSQAVIYAKSPDGHYTLVNREWERVTGRRREEAVGRTGADLFATATAQQFADNDRQAIDLGVPLRSEEVLHGPEGERTFFSIKVPLRGPDGQIQGMCGISTDITDLKRGEKELREAKDAAEAATAAKASFLAAMSHEIRTPMNGVVGMVDLLDQSDLEDDQRDMLATIRNSANALLVIINDILDYSKIEAGRLDLEAVSLSMEDIVDSVGKTVMTMSDTKDVRLFTAADPAVPPWLIGDPVRIRQILLNLASNAVKFTSTMPDRVGAVTIWSELAGKAEDGRALVRMGVRDNGIGIPREKIPNLFQAFTQADESTARRFGGTGLGLTICKQLVDMMDGTIEVESEVGVGSAFSVVLPLAVDRAREAAPSLDDVDGLAVAFVTALRNETRRIISQAYAHWGLDYRLVGSVDELPAIAAELAAEGRSLDVVVCGSHIPLAEIDRCEALLGALPGPTARIVELSPDRSTKTGLVRPGRVVVRASPIRLTDLRHAIAVASGRASPEVRYDEAEGHASVKARHAPSVEAAAASGQLILVAEDNLTNQDVIRRQLGLLGHACEIAPDGMAALAAWRSKHYALLLTDCHMPHMDGFELTAAVRADEAAGGRHTPIIAFTANALQGEAERCLAAGMDDYLSKPVEMAKLRVVLARWMPARSAADEAMDARGQVPPAGPDGGNGTAIDPAALRDTFGDDDNTFREILQDFVSPAMANIDEIRLAWEKRSADGVRFAAHKLKSSARSVGAHHLADACLSLEAAGKDSDWSTIDALSPTLDALMADVAAYVARL